MENKIWKMIKTQNSGGLSFGPRPWPAGSVKRPRRPSGHDEVRGQEAVTVPGTPAAAWQLAVQGWPGPVPVFTPGMTMVRAKCPARFGREAPT
jgi:hypothetical protein